MFPTQVWVAGRDFSVYISDQVEGYFIRQWLGIDPWVRWHYVEDLDDAGRTVPLWEWDFDARNAMFGPTDRKLELPHELVAKAKPRAK